MKVVICMTVLSSCSDDKQNNEEQNNYSIATHYDIRYNGEPVKYIKTENDTLELTLEMTYQSTIPFTLEFGMIDNFTQRPIKVKEGNEFQQDTVFKITLPETGEEFKTNNITVQINKLGNKYHNLIFWIKNNTILQNHSIRGYNFLRLNINGEKSALNKPDSDTTIPFTNNVEKEVFLELNPSVDKKGKNIECELQFNIDKIYEGENYYESYKNNLCKKMDFAVMVFENNKLLKLNGSKKFVLSSTTIEKNGKIKFSAKSNTLKNEELVFVAVPYPFINYETAERYQILAYNDLPYYQYKFDESFELF